MPKKKDNKAKATQKKNIKNIRVAKITRTTSKILNKKIPADVNNKTNNKNKVPVKTTTVPAPDSRSVEEETIKRVNHTITNIEGFLARWDSAKIKPSDLFPQILKMRRFYDLLINWQRNALKAKASGKSTNDARIKRLREFVAICRTYS